MPIKPAKDSSYGLFTRQMKKSEHTKSVPARGGRGTHAAAARAISFESIDAIFRSVGQKLREGLSGDAEKILVRTIDNYDHTPDNLANLKRLLSFTLETIGRYNESLETIRPYVEENDLSFLRPETQVRVTTQVAIAFSNTGDQPRAITLLKENRKKADEHELKQLLGGIEIALARVYRKLSEYPICRDHAHKALDHFREDGGWLGMAEAYREIANSYHQEGNSEKSLQNFDLGVNIIGENAAPFMLGKLYTDMSGAYWFLRRPQDGIACLEKSIEFFDQTDHALNSVIAYNNMGMNLVLVGEWKKAETMFNRAIEIAERESYVHVAGIYDSLGELNILREDLDEAEKWLHKGIDFAEKHNHAWYTMQPMRSMARCYLAQGKTKAAIEKARETVDFARENRNKTYGDMARLVLAEGYLNVGDVEECEDALAAMEETDQSDDFFILGNIQRIRGLAALREDDTEMAIHHFSRGLTIFEAAEDIYHTALMHFLLGANLESRNALRAKRHLTSALDIFKKLGIKSFISRTTKELERIEKLAPEAGASQSEKRSNSVVSQLLTVRLAEATASRELLFRVRLRSRSLSSMTKSGSIHSSRTDCRRRRATSLSRNLTTHERKMMKRRLRGPRTSQFFRCTDRPPCRHFCSSVLRRVRC